MKALLLAIALLAGIGVGATIYIGIQPAHAECGGPNC
jgi:hypothetical protein